MGRGRGESTRQKAENQGREKVAMHSQFLFPSPIDPGE